MSAIAAHPELDLQVLVAGTTVLERFGLPVLLVKEDGYPADGEMCVELEGSTPTHMAKSVGLNVVEFASEFQRLKPDVVLLIGDRYETLAAAVAAAYMNICIAHIQGGEVTASIDESARHAISKFAHFHFPSTPRSAEYLVRMGECPNTVFQVGCPSSDIAHSIDRVLGPGIVNGAGSGAWIDVEKPFLVVVFHPVTTQYPDERPQMEELLSALERLEMQSLLLWPNIDAGADNISEAIRMFRDQRKPTWLRTLVNLPPEDYLRVLANAVCAVGNSSSFVRDASYFGTPVVLVGNRQEGREASEHVSFCAPRADEIVFATRKQMAHGHYAPSTLYGDGRVSERIAEALSRLRPYVQKRLWYVEESAAAPVGVD